MWGENPFVANNGIFLPQFYLSHSYSGCFTCVMHTHSAWLNNSPNKLELTLWGVLFILSITKYKIWFIRPPFRWFFPKLPSHRSKLIHNKFTHLQLIRKSRPEREKTPYTLLASKLRRGSCNLGCSTLTTRPYSFMHYWMTIDSLTAFVLSSKGCPKIYSSWWEDQFKFWWRNHVQGYMLPIALKGDLTHSFLFWLGYLGNRSC